MEETSQATGEEIMKNAVKIKDPELTKGQQRLLVKILAAEGEIRFNLRGKRPLTTLEKLGLIKLDLRNEPCTKRGSRLFYVAEAVRPGVGK